MDVNSLLFGITQLLLPVIFRNPLIGSFAQLTVCFGTIDSRP